MDDEVNIYCSGCRRDTWHVDVVRPHVLTIEDETIERRILKCGGCRDFCFHERHSFNTDGEWEEGEVHIYPVPEVRAPRTFESIPARVDSIYREAIAAYNNRLHILCAGGLRGLVEGICADQGVVNGPIINQHGDVIRQNNLAGKIEGLAERHILTPTNAQALHHHRFLGNDALHELTPPDGRVLSIAINIIEHIMTSLYSLPEQAADLARLRQGI